MISELSEHVEGTTRSLPNSRSVASVAQKEIAAALWLCSDDASFAIGHALVVDGGQTV